MDQRELKKLVQLMNDNGLIELEIEREGVRVHLRKAGGEVAMPIAAMPGSLGMQPPPALPAAPGAEAPAEPATDPGTVTIPSPMVGTFYRRPNPEIEPYVEVGDQISEDSVICIVEAMKVNNEIKAEVEGEILEILVEDGQPVEFDQPLFTVMPA